MVRQRDQRGREYPDHHEHRLPKHQPRHRHVLAGMDRGLNRPQIDRVDPQQRERKPGQHAQPRPVPRGEGGAEDETT